MRILALVFSGIVFIAALDAAKPSYADDEDALWGTGIGAALGGLVGSQIGHGAGQLAATGIGVAAGGVIGNRIGHEMDSESSGPYRGETVATSQTAPFVYYPAAPNYVAPDAPLPPAQPETYVDQDSGTYCRPYSQEIVIDGEVRESFGTACLQPDGTWRVVR